VLPSRRLRVPATPADSGALAGWMRLTASQLDVDVPLWLAAREGVDRPVAGQPSARIFSACVPPPRSSRSPLNPYTLEAGFVGAAEAVLDDLTIFAILAARFR